ncbi:MAG: hypothetical protein ISS51_05355 [Dehalococcoidales bacterium]|nr:hypothetical protein [Dehalococcoidales bacterium]
MVLETWLTVDFAVRQFLLAGFELVRFCDEGFDLRYSLLPSSFMALLRLFKDAVKHNSKFSLEPDPPHPDKIGGFRASYQFWSFIRDKHKSLLDKIKEVSREYILEMNPELRDHILEEGKTAFFLTNSLDESKSTAKKMNLEWRKVASKFDKSWFELAEQLNNARNIAAHAVDADKIGRQFGLTGGNLSELIRDKCRSILSILLSVRINQK